MCSKASMFLVFPLLCAGQDIVPTDDSANAGCSLLGPQRERILEAGKYGRKPGRLTELTAQVMGRLSHVRSFVPGGSRTNSQLQLEQMGTIDRHIFGTLQAKGVTPAPRTDDYEFIRRVTLDLTGRIPLPERVTQFIADSRVNKREV